MQALVNLGFTKLEASIYTFLLQESPATGYRVAQALSKPPGATYKAIEALESKGAVLVDDGDRRMCRAVSATELLDQLDHAHRANREKARDELSRLGEPGADDRMYRLRTPAQVFERCAAMLDSCEEFVVGSACPVPFEHVRDPLQCAVGRGIAVGIKLFDDASLPGATIVRDSRRERAYESGPGQWLCVVTDGAESLLALFDTQGRDLRQAFFTAGPFASWTLFTGWASNLKLIAIEQMLNAGADADAIREMLHDFDAFETPRSRGRRLLTQRYRAPGKRGRRPAEGGTSNDDE